jgi:hypothetical protein
MSPRSGWYTQKCPCGSDRRPEASITLAGSTLGVLPRRKSSALTVYICPDCLKDPKRKTRQRLIEAVLTAAKLALESNVTVTKVHGT